MIFTDKFVENSRVRPHQIDLSGGYLTVAEELPDRLEGNVLPVELHSSRRSVISSFERYSSWINFSRFSMIDTPLLKAAPDPILITSTKGGARRKRGPLCDLGDL